MTDSVAAPKVQRPPLRRARPNSADMPAPVVAGVCSGLSVHLRISVNTVRVAMILMSLVAGAGVLLYLWLVITVPLDDLNGQTEAGPVSRLRSPLRRVGRDTRAQVVNSQLLLAGVVLVALAIALVIAVGVFNWNSLGLVAGASVVGGIVVIWTQVARASSWSRPQVWAPTLAGAVLILLGIVLLFVMVKEYPPQMLLFGVTVGILVVVALGVALTPVWFKIAGDTATAKSREARETERADIAAHLHDSVLQTLTLIRGAADDPVRVRALALTQERELRAWLYTGRDDPGSSTARILRDKVEALESRFGVEVSVVTVGDVIPGPNELAAIAAVGEATANALRHGTPPVSVYMEVRPKDVEVFVKDTGPGFDLEKVPADRHGVRDSIIGRVERVGGKASVRSWVQGVQGTEVHICVPRSDVQEERQNS